jgi:Fe-S-cluster containining protein
MDDRAPEDQRRARLSRHLRLLDDGVAPIVARYRGQIQCRAGCSECCHQTFKVSELEGEELRRGLAAAPAAAAAAIALRAASYTPGRGEPCPALDEQGRCGLYEHRPRICRKYGIPLWDPNRPEELRTCRLNFRGVHDLDAELIAPPQAAWAADWIALREELAAGPQVNQTIAAWLRGDGRGADREGENSG